MLGAICGDVIGRPYEFEYPVRSKDFSLFREGSRFSDDTILTVAIAHAIMTDKDYNRHIREYAVRYLQDDPKAFSKKFAAWATDNNSGQGLSTGNGSAMRVSSVGWFASTLDEAIKMATETALPSHGSEEGIKGAIAVAVSVWLSVHNRFDEIKDTVTQLTGYDLNRKIDDIRWNYPRFKSTCSESVPEAILCALEAESFEDAIRNAVSLGNDADTHACIAGAIVEAKFGIPNDISSRCLNTLTPDLFKIFQMFERRVRSY